MVARGEEEKRAIEDLYFVHLLKLFEVCPPTASSKHWFFPGSMSTSALSGAEDRLGDLIYEPTVQSLDINSIFKKPAELRRPKPKDAAKAKEKGKGKEKDKASEKVPSREDDFAKLRRLQELRKKSRRGREETQEQWM